MLLTEAVRTETGELEGVRFETRGERRIRNVVEPVRLFAAIPADRPTEAHEIDPVCRMLIADGREAGSLRHRDTLYRFCSLDCARRFLGDPDAYARPDSLGGP